MRHITDVGLDLIKRFEGFSPTIYICPAGYPTVGYGHLVGPREREQFRHGMSEVGAAELLKQDVCAVEVAVLRLITVPLTDGQFDALVSFTFNLGSGALQRSSLRRVINRAEHAAVPAQLSRWVWAGGRCQPGLVLRRQAESFLYARTQWVRPSELATFGHHLVGSPGRTW